MTALKSFINSGAYDVFVAKFDGDDANHFWSHSFGGQNPLRDTAYGHAITVDAEGDFYITGYFSGSLDVGGGTLLAMGSNSIFIAKFKGEDGSHIWSKSLSIKGQNSVYAYSIAVDKKGDIIITGYFSGTLNFGGVPLSSTGRKDLFIAKFTGINGSHEWSHRFGGQNSKRDSIKGYSVAIDKNGDLTVTGYFSGTVNIGDKKFTSVGGSDFFVAKFKGTDGSKVWVSSFEGTWEDMGKCLTIDPQDNVLITGYFTGTLDFGDEQLSSTGRRDIFLVKFGGADGRHIWSHSFGGSGPNWDSARAYSVAASKSGDLVITGYFNGTLDFGGGPLISKSNNDIFVAKFNGDGDHIWSHNYGGKKTNFAHSYAVSIDSNEDVIVTGDFSGTLDLGGGLLASTAKRDLFVAKYNGADGSHIWSCISRGTWETLSRDVTIDKKGNVLITGFSSGTVHKFKFNIDTNYPVLLLPVRLETRFMDNELWVRIHPDQVSIESHRNDLNDHEKAMYSLYSSAKSDEDKRSAWRVMVQHFGSKRAAWIIRSKDKPELINIEKKPEYKQGVWGNPPQVRTFPDRFVVCLYKGDGCVKKAIGNQIPCELPLMGDPEKEFNGNLFDGDSSWVNDFDRAEKIGMALKIPLDPNEDKHFTRVIAVGIKYSGTSEGQKMLEDLIDNHHYTSGFSFLPYGTPTNNTMNTKSGYSESLIDNEKRYDIECCEGPEDAEIESHNSQVVARAFGMDPALFKNIENAHVNNSPQERELKEALWPALGDYFLTFALSNPPGIETREMLQDHFTEFVTACGPLTAVGIGNQPYGILPVTRINGWKASGLDGHSKVRFYTKLHAILFELYKKWLDMAIDTELVPRITGDSDNPDDELLQILAMESTSTSYGIRPVVKEPFLYDFRSGSILRLPVITYKCNISSKLQYIEYFVKAGEDVEKDKKLFCLGGEGPYHYNCHNAPSNGKILKILYHEKVSYDDSLILFLSYSFLTINIISNHTGRVYFDKKKGDFVKKGDLLCLVGPHSYIAPFDGNVSEVLASNNQHVDKGDVLLIFLIDLSSLTRTIRSNRTGWVEYFINAGDVFKKGETLYYVWYRLERHEPMYIFYTAPFDGIVSKVLKSDKEEVNEGDALLILLQKYYDVIYNFPPWIFPTSEAKDIVVSIDKSITLQEYTSWSNGLDFPTTITSNHTGNVYFRVNVGDVVNKGIPLCSIGLHKYYAPFDGKVLQVFKFNSDKVNKGDAFILFGDVFSKKERIRSLIKFPDSTNETISKSDDIFMGILDLYTYRLDAWFTSLATKRLQAMREHEPEGIYLGAYGCLEDLQPEEKSNDIKEEYIHAPSADQAAAAAVLRNAYLTQKHSDKGKPFRINLTSDRVRRALRLLDGLREGQEMGALLGYMFERGLHDNGMDCYIDEFRMAFSLVANKLTEPKASETAEAVAARNVVDGLALAEKWGKSKEDVFKLISEKLSNNDKVLSNKEKLDLENLIDNTVMDSQDGMADLLLTESMYQLVQGNFERAGAALDAAAGKARTPEIESIQTPISGTGLGHRVCILFNGSINGGQGPRSKAEPRLGAWFGDILGDMNKVGCIAHIKFDFNKATSEELEILPGIGPEKAKLIITDREKNGDYTQLEDLKRVQGIGESTINELRKILDPYKFDFNKATFKELEILPGIGPEKAKLIITDREKNGDYTQLEDLKRVQGIGESIINELRKIELDPYLVSLKDLDINPLDFLYMSSFPLSYRGKDDSGEPVSEETELEQRMAYFIRKLRNLPACAVVRFDFERATDHFTRSTAEAVELGQTVLDLLGKSSFLRPDSLWLQEDEDTPAQYDIDELFNRVTDAHDSISRLLERFNMIEKRIVVDFFNGVINPSEIVERIKDDPNFLRASSQGYGISTSLASKILKVRDSLAGGKFSSVKEIDNIPGVGPDTMHDIYYSLQVPVNSYAGEINEILLEANHFGIESTISPSLFADPELVSRKNNAIDEIRARIKKCNKLMGLISWDKISGEDSVKFIDFLEWNYKINWAKTDDIKIIYNEIRINSEDHSLSLKLIEGKTKARLTIDDVETDEFIVREKNNTRNIYLAISLRDSGDHSKAINVLVKAMKAVFGDGFMVLPTFTAPNPQDLQTIYQDASRIHMWLHQAAQISPALSHLEDTIMACDAWRSRAIDPDSDYSGTLDEIVTEAFTLRVAQLPGDEEQGWLALLDEELKKDRTEDEIEKRENGIKENGRPKGYLSIVSLAPETIDYSNKLAGLLVYQWEEKIPDKQVDTGLSFYYNQPNSQPPQSLLLAVPGELEERESRWTVDELVDIVRDTMDLAKVRTVDSEALQYGGPFPPALFLKTESKKLKYEKNLEFYHGVWKNFLEELFCLDFNTFEVGEKLRYRIIKGFRIYSDYSDSYSPVISSNNDFNYLECKECSFVLPAPATTVDITVLNISGTEITAYDEKNQEVPNTSIFELKDETSIHTFSPSSGVIHSVLIRNEDGLAAVLKICMRPKEV